jgi:hypothetical protein
MMTEKRSADDGGRRSVRERHVRFQAGHTMSCESEVSANPGQHSFAYTPLIRLGYRLPVQPKGNEEARRWGAGLES